MIKSRIAPTPSGFLHVGNVFNFLLTWVKVNQQNGVLQLRIDDADKPRCKVEYIEDIFNTLNWLGITYQDGPTNLANFKQHFSQQNKQAIYLSWLQKLIAKDLIFACTCSRKQLGSNKHYPGTCLQKNVSIKRPNVNLRINDSHCNYAVIWRKDNIPAYHLFSIVDDLTNNINYIIRGQDLAESTLVQTKIAALIGNNNFNNITFKHHQLLLEPSGQKLAKSEGSLAIKTMRSQGVTPQDIYKQFAAWVNQPTKNINTINDLLTLNVDSVLI